MLTRVEVRAVLSRLRGEPWLVASILYGSGLRLLESLRLRVKDVDLIQRRLLVRDAKGAKDRITLIHSSLVEPLNSQIGRVREQHEIAKTKQYAGVELPYALARKHPSAHLEVGW